MLKINTSVFALTIVFTLAGCFGETETHLENGGATATGASGYMKRQEDRSGATMSGIPSD